MIFTLPEEIIPLNQQLKSFLPADTKWYDSALLRLPGTFNHKARARGGESLPVVLEDPTVSVIAPWSPSALGEHLGTGVKALRS